MIMGGFGHEKTKPNKANLFRIEYCVMRIAKRKKAKMSVNLEFIRVHPMRSAKPLSRRVNS